MEQRSIGTTDLRLSVLGFGCASVGSRAGASESRRALDLAIDSGITYFDTADMYGLGGSEEILGRVIRGRRDRVVIASKCGYTFSSGLKAVAWIKPLLRPLVTRLKGIKAAASSAMASQRSQRFDPAYITQSVEESLRRLGTDRIDLFYLHDPAMEVIERGEAIGALGTLKQAGKIRHIGVSCEPDVAVRALRDAGSGIAAVQVNANVLEQRALREVLPLAAAQGVGFIARQPFAHGRLMESKEALAALQSRGLSMDGASLASFALRYLRDVHGVSCVLPGMMRPDHLRANLRAIAEGPLTETERAAATALGDQG